MSDLHATPIFWKTIRTYLLWGFFWATFTHWLGIMLLFFAGTLTNRDDLGFFGKIAGVFGGVFYGLIVFTLPALWNGLIALPFVLLAAIAVAIWNKANDRHSYVVPLLAGLLFGSALAVFSQYFPLAYFADLPYFGAVNVAAIVLASAMCWRRFRRKNPAVFQ